eukprot:gene8062-biopygen6099
MIIGNLSPKHPERTQSRRHTRSASRRRRRRRSTRRGVPWRSRAWMLKMHFSLGRLENTSFYTHGRAYRRCREKRQRTRTGRGMHDKIQTNKGNCPRYGVVAHKQQEACETAVAAVLVG